MRPLEFITGHVIFKLRYDQIYQMKTTDDVRDELFLLSWLMPMSESALDIPYPNRKIFLFHYQILLQGYEVKI